MLTEFELELPSTYPNGNSLMSRPAVTAGGVGGVDEVKV